MNGCVVQRVVKAVGIGSSVLLNVVVSRKTTSSGLVDISCFFTWAFSEDGACEDGMDGAWMGQGGVITSKMSDWKAGSR